MIERNVTIIIPTHDNDNRRKYIDRSLEYYAEFPCEVILCDSSTKRLTGITFPDNVKYVHAKGKNFIEKMILAIGIAHGELIACCADDDFLMKDALQLGIQEMGRHVGISACVGQYIGFKVPFDKKFQPLLYKHTPWSYKVGDSANNVQSFMENYYMVLWGLYRKELILLGYQAVLKAKITNDNFIEFILGIVLSYHGKIHFIKNIWGAREVNAIDSWGRRHDTLMKVTLEEMNAVHSGVKKALVSCTGSDAFHHGFSSYKIFCNNLVSSSWIIRFKDVLLRKIVRISLSNNKSLEIISELIEESEKTNT